MEPNIYSFLKKEIMNSEWKFLFNEKWILNTKLLEDTKTNIIDVFIKISYWADYEQFVKIDSFIRDQLRKEIFNSWFLYIENEKEDPFQEFDNHISIKLKFKIKVDKFKNIVMNNNLENIWGILNWNMLINWSESTSLWAFWVRLLEKMILNLQMIQIL